MRYKQTEKNRKQCKQLILSISTLMPYLGLMRLKIKKGLLPWRYRHHTNTPYHVQRAKTNQPIDYKGHGNPTTHECANSKTHQPINSQTHQLKNTSTHQLKNSSIQKLKKSSAHQPTNSSTYKLINSSTHQLINLSTHKLINSQIHQLKKSSTQKLKLLFDILQQHSNFRCILAEIRVKK